MSDKLEVLNFILQTIVENKGNIQKSLLENKLTTKYGNDNIVFFHNLISIWFHLIIWGFREMNQKILF